MPRGSPREFFKVVKAFSPNENIGIICNRKREHTILLQNGWKITPLGNGGYEPGFLMCDLLYLARAHPVNGPTHVKTLFLDDL
jgi:hypothetical protein